MEKALKPKISGTICLILGIAFAIVGLYYYHMQYLCYEYTPLQFILAFVVCLGGVLLSLPLSKNAGKKKKVKNAVITALQTVEKVQRELGFLSYMWYNVNGDENVGRKEKF